MTTTATTAADVVITDETTDGALFTQYQGQFQPLAAFITVNFDGDVPSMYAFAPESGVFDSYDELFDIDPTLTAAAVNEIMRDIAGDVAVAFNAMENVFNPRTGLYEANFDSDEAQEALDRIRTTVEQGSENGERFEGAEISDEVLGMDGDLYGALAAVTADSTDAELAGLTSAVVTSLEAEFKDMSYVVTRYVNSDIHPLLEARRDELIAERDD
ncbi:hypothetical protein [Mycolicibacter minnesotensis]